jgi:hypothetical protein
MWTGMDGSIAIHSPQLLEANRQLLALRKQVKEKRRMVASAAADAQESAAGLPWDYAASGEEGPGASAVLPRHLGWGSEALTAVLRRRQAGKPVDDAQSWLNALHEKIDSTSSETHTAGGPASKRPQSAMQNVSGDGGVKLYPDIGLGMLRQEQTAPGRLWLMLRYLDEEGRGVLRIDIISKHLTTKSTKLRLCGKRQLRNLLRDGEGVFWTRDKEHVWLYSAAKVAFALGVERLTGRPVSLPVTALLEGIGTFRAHLYVAFHSGRMKKSPKTPHGGQGVPIARDTLAGLSGVGRSSQRAYEARVGLQVQANFAVGHMLTEENQEKQAWQQGAALFELKDYRGQQGKKGKTYLAWQLPNSYSGQHQQRPKGRQKRINRKLNDLVMKGMPGNVGGTNETCQAEKVYYPNGKLAVRAYGRDPERALYWEMNRTGNGRFAVWQSLGSG